MKSGDDLSIGMTHKFITAKNLVQRHHLLNAFLDPKKIEFSAHFQHYNILRHISTADCGTTKYKKSL